jgi:hypothetical protein
MYENVEESNRTFWQVIQTSDIRTTVLLYGLLVCLLTYLPTLATYPSSSLAPFSFPNLRASFVIADAA